MWEVFNFVLQRLWHSTLWSKAWSFKFSYAFFFSGVLRITAWRFKVPRAYLLCVVRTSLSEHGSGIRDRLKRLHLVSSSSSLRCDSYHIRLLNRSKFRSSEGCTVVCPCAFFLSVQHVSSFRFTDSTGPSVKSKTSISYRPRFRDGAVLPTCLTT